MDTSLLAFCYLGDALMFIAPDHEVEEVRDLVLTDAAALVGSVHESFELVLVHH